MAKVLINLDCSVRGLKANWEAGWAARLTGLRNAFSRKFEFGPRALLDSVDVRIA